MDLREAAEEMHRLSILLDDSLRFNSQKVKEYAEAEEAYRLAKAKAWVKNTDGVAKEREAHVDADTAGERRRRDVAEGMQRAALEGIRSRRTQISALQSLLAASREETAFSRTGPEYVP